MTTPNDWEKLREVETALLKRWPENKLEPTLDRIAALSDALGSPQLSYPTIHITGTNGKTTTTRMIDSILYEMDFRTGRFTSPHLESITERIAINYEPISPEAFVATYKDIELYLEMIDQRQPFPLSFFEVMVAMSFVAFAEYPVDVGIFEVGMGGEWDATNVINSAVSVVTPIGLDHMQYLGGSIEEIARTKSGIIKPKSIAVLSRQEMEVAKILLTKCIEVEATPLREGIEYAILKRELAIGGQLLTVQGISQTYKDIFIPLYGAHQGSNAAMAIAAVEAFAGSKQVDDEIIRAGLAQVDSPGRCEIVHRNPTVIIDAAHNPHGAAALVHTIKEEFDFSSVIAVVAPMGDKDVRGILEELDEIVNQVVVTTNSMPRSMEINDLEELANSIFGLERVSAMPSLATAISKTIEQAKLENDVNDENCAVIITGSVVTAGEARSILKQMKPGSHGGDRNS